MMKIVLLILLATALADYRPSKLRGPPYLTRSPIPNKQFAKKWYQQYPPLRTPLRNRPSAPIPLHMPMPPGHNLPSNHMLSAPSGTHKLPISMPTPPPRGIPQPPPRFWKMPQAPGLQFVAVAQEGFPIVDNYKAVGSMPEKFLVAPTVVAQEYDYHIQTNSIPTHINPIKQVGEKGPIHTIPAPNLSPRDKPLMIDETRFNNPPYVKVEQSHQYQVTEPPENNLQYREQSRVQQNQQFYQQQQPQPQQAQKQVEVEPQQLYYTSEVMAVPQNQHQAPAQEVYLNENLSPKELYQLIGSVYPPQQSKQQANYQVQEQQPLFEPEHVYVQELRETKPTESKTNFAPEFHSFNYDEQAHQKTQKNLSKKELSSLVSAGYNLDSSATAIDTRDSMEDHSQVVQSYFDSRSDLLGNHVEPDAKPVVDRTKEIEHAYYSTLPNKEAAERLAKLQAAGKVNSKLMTISESQKNDGMRIYIPDDFDVESEENSKDDNVNNRMKQQAVDYEEYSQEDKSVEELEKGFGHRLKPKRN